jgi:predicted nucleic acid-binding protein
MHKVIISYTSCLIVFDNIGELEIIHQVYGEVITTHEVEAEFGKELPVICQMKVSHSFFNHQNKNYFFEKIIFVLISDSM